jgi:hypothetical protein
MEDGTDAIEVRGEVVLLVLDDLGGHVIGTTTVAVRIVLLLETAFAQAEIADEQMAGDVHKDVLGLCYIHILLLDRDKGCYFYVGTQLQ